MKMLFLPVALLVMCGLFFIAVSGDADETATGTITGRIGIRGVGPMMDGTVFFVDAASGPPPSATKYWRVPTHAFSVDENARFVVMLPMGDYYMGAIERKSDEVLGPPQEGDYFFIYQDAKKQPKKITVKENDMIDIGFINEAVPFRRTSLARKGITSISGVIRDEKGAPVEGMMVSAFTNSTMFGKPLFVSDRSGEDGSYLLRVDRGGKYYLRVRANYGGGPPAIDELMGVYREGKPLVIKTGARKKGANITVQKAGLQK